MQYALDNAKRLKHQVAVLFIDLDRFKHINDSLGHHFGDMVLRQLGERIAAGLRSNDIAARLGGDEFVVVLNPINTLEQVTTVVDKLTELIQEPITIDRHPMHLKASIGISLYPDDGSDPETLIKYADSALYEAKDQRKNTCCFYTADLTRRAVERMELEHELSSAIDDGQLEVYFQPVMGMSDNNSISAEALIRWRHPEKGLIPPLKFIPIAEDAGSVDRITDFVLDTCCRQMVKWREVNLPVGMISVNISRIELSQTDIAERVTNVLNQTKCPSECLCIEVTESTLISLSEEVAEQLKLLQQIGVSIAIDDFGTGLSSLGNLKRLPLNRLKVDCSFIRGMEVSEKDAEIVKLVVEFSKVIGLEVVAEGLETEEQEVLLQEMNCDYVQGYLYSKPLALDDFHKWCMGLANTFPSSAGEQTGRNPPVDLKLSGIGQIFTFYFAAMA